MAYQLRQGDPLGSTKCSGQLGLPHSIQRILREKNEVATSPSPYWHAAPLSDEDPFEWHFTIKGPVDSEFEGGSYHGRIVLPRTYPYSPPCVILLTQNGRFETGRKVCLSASNYHPELWQPAWGLRTMLDALHAFFPTPGEGALYSIDWPKDVRKKIARDSGNWACSVCGKSNSEIVKANCPEIRQKRPILPDYVERVPIRPVPGSTETTGHVTPQSTRNSEIEVVGDTLNRLDHSATGSTASTSWTECSPSPSLGRNGDSANPSQSEAKPSAASGEREITPVEQSTRTAPKLSFTNVLLVTLDLGMIILCTCAVLVIVHLFVVR